MKSAVDVADAEVQKMVEESVEHAFTDMRARQWIEARLRAEETLAAARKGLVDCAADLDTAYKQQVESAMRPVEDQIASNPDDGDPTRLKALLATLDEVTKPLAELLMDKSMEAMLRKKGLIS